MSKIITIEELIVAFEKKCNFEIPVEGIYECAVDAVQINKHKDYKRSIMLDKLNTCLDGFCCDFTDIRHMIHEWPTLVQWKKEGLQTMRDKIHQEERGNNVRCKVKVKSKTKIEIESGLSRASMAKEVALKKLLKEKEKQHKDDKKQIEYLLQICENQKDEIARLKKRGK